MCVLVHMAGAAPQQSCTCIYQYMYTRPGAHPMSAYTRGRGTTHARILMNMCICGRGPTFAYILYVYTYVCVYCTRGRGPAPGVCVHMAGAAPRCACAIYIHVYIYLYICIYIYIYMQYIYMTCCRAGPPWQTLPNDKYMPAAGAPPPVYVFIWPGPHPGAHVLYIYI